MSFLSSSSNISNFLNNANWWCALIKYACFFIIYFFFSSLIKTNLRYNSRFKNNIIADIFRLRLKYLFFRIRIICLRMNKTNSFLPSTVSYTHLDVYKRQDYSGNFYRLSYFCGWITEYNLSICCICQHSKAWYYQTYRQYKCGYFFHYFHAFFLFLSFRNNYCMPVSDILHTYYTVFIKLSSYLTLFLIFRILCALRIISPCISCECLDFTRNLFHFFRHCILVLRVQKLMQFLNILDVYKRQSYE